MKYIQINQINEIFQLPLYKIYKIKPITEFHVLSPNNSELIESVLDCEEHILQIIYATHHDKHSSFFQIVIYNKSLINKIIQEQSSNILWWNHYSNINHIVKDMFLSYKYQLKINDDEKPKRCFSIGILFGYPRINCDLFVKELQSKKQAQDRDFVKSNNYPDFFTIVYYKNHQESYIEASKIMKKYDNYIQQNGGHNEKN